MTFEFPAWINSIETGIPLDRDEHWRKATTKNAASKAITFATVMDILEDLSRSYSLESITSRCFLSESNVMTVAKTCATALFQIQGKATREVDDMTASDFHFHQHFLVHEHALVRAARQGKYHMIHNWLGRCGDHTQNNLLLKSVLLQWKPLVKNFFLNAVEPRNISSIIQMIEASDIPANRVLVTYAIPAHKLPAELSRTKWHMREEAKVRRGQWRVRLHICSVDADSPAAIDAAISNKGLYVLLAAAEAYLALAIPKE
jgi:hypothetical protein